LSREKNLELLLDAFAVLARDEPDTASCSSARRSTAGHGA
jgi:hypothetical protein